MTEIAAPIAPVEATRRRRSPATWFANQNPRELAAWGVLLAASILVHLIGLGNRPFHHDESQDAYFSYLSGNTGFHYDPLLHGPTRFYLIKLVYLVFGD